MSKISQRFLMANQCNQSRSQKNSPKLPSSALGIHSADFDKDVQLLLQNNCITRREMVDHEACLQILNQVADQLGPQWSVKPFGSFVNGFGTRGSDLDATCYCEGIKQQDNHLALDELRKHLKPLLMQHPRFEMIEEIWGARIPLLKLKFNGTVEVDLSCHNPQALQNTHLLKAYANLDPAIPDFVVAVKLWAKKQGICGAASGHLSSYAFTLMAIFFLQVDPKVGMPCLPVTACDPAGFKTDIAVSWLCPLPVSILLYRFFNFFATTFSWGSEVVAVRFGKRCLATDSSFQNLPARKISRFHIEDPFLKGRNLNCTLRSDQEMKLHEQFQNAVEAFQSGTLPESLKWNTVRQSILHDDVANIEGWVAQKDARNEANGVRPKRLFSQGGSDDESTESGESVNLAHSGDISGSSDSDEIQLEVLALPRISAAALWLGPESPSTNEVATAWQ